MSAPRAQVVTVGAVSVPGAERAAAAVAALTAAGLTVGAQVFVEEDDAALQRVLEAPAMLTLVIAPSAGSPANTVQRVLGRLTAKRLPQDAAVWTGPETEAGWAVEAGDHRFVVLPAAGRIEQLLHRHLPAFVGGRLGPDGPATRTLKTIGVPLGQVEDRLKPWLDGSGDVDVSVVAVDDEIWVRLRARGSSTAVAALTTHEAQIAARLGADCYGHDGDTLEQVVGRLLIERGLMLSVAESCTGGLVGHRLTSVAGSSAYFERGVVVYSNRAKQELLGVPEEMLRTHGAVSAPTAEAMARGIQAASGSRCGLAITGIAGPDGGTPSKPVGTVFIGVAVGDDVQAHRFVFPGNRAAIKWRSAQAALDLLRRRVSSEPAPR